MNPIEKQKNNQEIPISDKSFQKVICFYLFECPARTVREKNRKNEPITVEQPHPGKIYEYSAISKKGKTLASRGFRGGKLNTLRAAMIRVAGNEFELKTGTEHFESTKKEYLIISDSSFITEKIFSFIRNSFAHGEFDVNDGWYHLTNHHRGKCKGKAVLHVSTLLKWIDVVNMSIEDIKEIVHSNRNSSKIQAH